MSNGVLLITKHSYKWNSIFNEKLIFNELTDEHILRILFLQKIKISQDINDRIKIYLDDCDLDSFNISEKLYKILKYSNESYNIDIQDIEHGYDLEEIRLYNKKVDTYKKK